MDCWFDITHPSIYFFPWAQVQIKIWKVAENVFLSRFILSFGVLAQIHAIHAAQLFRVLHLTSLNVTQTSQPCTHSVSFGPTSFNLTYLILVWPTRGDSSLPGSSELLGRMYPALGSSEVKHTWDSTWWPWRRWTWQRWGQQAMSTKAEDFPLCRYLEPLNMWRWTALHIQLK